MKKTYTAPLTKVVKINVEQMICDSQVRIGSKYNGSATIESKDDDFNSSDDLW